MQNKLLRFGSIVIFFLAIIFFIVAGSVDDVFSVFGSDSSYGTFGKYNGTPIGFQNDTFNNITENYSKYMRAANNVDLNTDNRRGELYYQSMVLTIQNMHAAEKIADAGFVPGSELINRMIRPLRKSGMPFSKEVYGNDTKIYAQERSKLYDSISDMLSNTRYMRDLFGTNAAFDSGIFAVSAAGTSSRLSYFDLIQYYILQEIFAASSTVDYGLKANPAETDFIAKMGAEKHSFDAVAFDTSSYPRAETKAYGEEHKDLFTKYDLSVLTYESKSDAESALKKIKNGEKTFEDSYLESELHSYAGSQGKSNLTYKYQLKLAVEDEKELEGVTSLAKDEFSPVVKTSTGYSFFRCDGDKTEADLSKDDVLDVVSTYISSNERTLIEDYYIAKGKEFAAAARETSFAAACKKYNVEKISVPAFPLNYKNASVADSLTSDINQIASGSRDEKFLKSAFSLKKIGEVSEPVLLGWNVIVLGLTGIQNEKITDEKRDSISSALTGYDRTNSYMSMITDEKVENNFDEAFEAIKAKNK